MIYCFCGRSFEKNQQASQHCIFAHRVRLPYRALYWKGYLADPFNVSPWDSPFPPRGMVLGDLPTRKLSTRGVLPS